MSEQAKAWNDLYFRCGVVARREGRTLADNPFKNDGFFAQSWAAGWGEENRWTHTPPN
jgi:hypothetical protein